MTLDEDEVEAKRDRSPPFPYIGLAQSVELARKLYQVARTAEVRLGQIAPHWNTTATSGALPRYAGALQGYGLIESSGSRESRKIHITDAGRRILEDTRPGVASDLLAVAAIRPRMFDELFKLWGKRRPTDDIARSALQFDFNFTPVAAKRFLTVFDEAIGYLPDEQAQSPEVATVAPIEKALSEVQLETSAPQPLQFPASDGQAAEFLREYRRDVFALDEGEATITLPKVISRASFADLSDWLDLLKRRIERSIED